MVKPETRWMLTYLEKTDPKRIAEVTGDSEQQCWEHLEDLRIELNRCVKEREKYTLQLYQELREWVESIPGKDEIKRKSLLGKLKDAKHHPEKYDVPKLMREYKAMTDKPGVISKEQIEKAREYPLQDLVDHRRFMSKCPFHPDKTASMYIKKNFYHCFACDASGDVIDFVMKTKNMSFPEAVKFLTT